MNVWVVVKTADQGTNGIITEVIGVFDSEDKANKQNRLLNSQVAYDLRDKIWYTHSCQKVK